jgi:hypothetical protein
MYNDTFYVHIRQSANQSIDIKGQRNFRFRTTAIGRTDGDALTFSSAGTAIWSWPVSDVEATCGRTREDGFPILNGTGPCRRSSSETKRLAAHGRTSVSNAGMVHSGAAGSSPARKLILVTTTYGSDMQIAMLSHLAHDVLANVTNALWIVVEDAAVKSSTVAALLNSSSLPTEHFAIGPTRRKGHEQRNLACEETLDTNTRVGKRMFDECSHVLIPAWIGRRVYPRSPTGRSRVQQYDVPRTLARPCAVLSLSSHRMKFVSRHCSG